VRDKEKRTDLLSAYAEGFAKTCSAKKVDGVELMKWAQYQDPEKPSLLRRGAGMVAGGMGEAADVLSGLGTPVGAMSSALSRDLPTPSVGRYQRAVQSGAFTPGSPGRKLAPGEKIHPNIQAARSKTLPQLQGKMLGADTIARRRAGLDRFTGLFSNPYGTEYSPGALYGRQLRRAARAPARWLAGTPTGQLLGGVAEELAPGTTTAVKQTVTGKKPVGTGPAPLKPGDVDPITGIVIGEPRKRKPRYNPYALTAEQRARADKRVAELRKYTEPK
jgi:hypothetical protein